jgi:hypothetical protein
VISNDTGPQTAFKERSSKVEELFDALSALELEAAVDAAAASTTSDWWGRVGGWLSAIVFSLSGATALLAFVTLHEAGEVASVTLGVTALFLTLALAATLGLRPGAAGAAATTRYEASRRFMETVRRFRRTEARFMESKDAWQRYDALADIMTSIKSGRLNAQDINSVGGS